MQWAVASILLCTSSFVLGGTLRFDQQTPKKPDFGPYYITSGMIVLPYAEIREPFSAAFDMISRKSRIDYYDGMDMTFQRADMKPYGKGFKIAPIQDETHGLRVGCFVTDGQPGPSKTAGGAIGTQSVLPNITYFQYVGSEIMEGKQCDKWALRNVVETRVNAYTLWVTSDNQVPVKYDMIGYDSLMGSHYDRYYIIYTSFTKVRPLPQTFEVPNNSTCGGFPGPGLKEEHRLLFNPMQEYINGHESHLEPMFMDFKSKHEKKYSGIEHSRRRENFRQNVRFVHSTNRAGLSYRTRLNHLADLTDIERRRMRGYRYSPGSHGGLPFVTKDMKTTGLPSSLDWRIMGAVTPVKDQAICGSCWSFGTTGTLEGSYFVKHGVRILLSQQQLMDCSWGYGNNACDGGEDFRAYKYIMKHGLSTEDSYGSYLGNDGRCHAQNATVSLKISGYVNVTTNSVNALKIALFNKGPISVSIDAAHKSLSFYDHGVYFEPKCGNGPDQLDHSVLAVGYGVLNGQAYWLIKNSWSFYWGNDGYVLMSQKDNNCGVMTTPTYGIVE